MPLLGDPNHLELIDFMKNKAPTLLNLNSAEKPRALIVVTAHWETRIPAVSLRKDSKLFFDYSGFPAETYKYTYNATGDPLLGHHVAEVIKSKGGFLDVQKDSQRGWDHGVFVPLKLIAPAGLDIPLIMVSILKSQTPADLFKLGSALSSLRDEGFAVLGSGSTFHSFDGFFAAPLAKKKYVDAASAFESQMYQVLDRKFETDRVKRLSEFAQWQTWPHASTVQPPKAQEHFSPLVALVGSMKSCGDRVDYAEVMGLPASCWTFD